MQRNVLIIVFLFIKHLYGSSTESWPSSIISEEPGHYPYSRCHVTNVVLIPEETKGVFYIRNTRSTSHCSSSFQIWDFGQKPDIQESDCDLKFDIGHVVLIFYIYGISNYFHIHWDTVIPLYRSLYYMNKEYMNKTIVVLPSVETKRLQKINWQTDGFSGKNRNKYWNEITEFMTGNHTYLPLDENFLKGGKRICFREVYLGAVTWNKNEKDFVLSFVNHVLTQHGIRVNPVREDRIGIISRKGRRRILNEDELVAALQNLAPTELVQFEKLTYKEQIELVQKYSVLAGMNGAGLMNCIFLPPGSTCIQLVPFGARGHLNFEEYGQFLKSRGPYLVWHNTHADRNVEKSGPHNADTSVHVSEFIEVVREALELSRKARQMETNDPMPSLHHDDL